MSMFITEVWRANPPPSHIRRRLPIEFPPPVVTPIISRKSTKTTTAGDALFKFIYKKRRREGTECKFTQLQRRFDDYTLHQRTEIFEQQWPNGCTDLGVYLTLGVDPE